MRRPSPPKFGLSVPHRQGAATLPNARRGRPSGVGWRGRRPEKEPSRTRRVIAVLGVSYFLLLAVGFFVAVSIDPLLVRRPPRFMVIPVLGPVVIGFVAWFVMLLGGLFRGRRVVASTGRDGSDDTASPPADPAGEGGTAS